MRANKTPEDKMFRNMNIKVEEEEKLLDEWKLKLGKVKKNFFLMKE